MWLTLFTTSLVTKCLPQSEKHKHKNRHKPTQHIPKGHQQVLKSTEHTQNNSDALEHIQQGQKVTHHNK